MAQARDLHSAVLPPLAQLRTSTTTTRFAPLCWAGFTGAGGRARARGVPDLGISYGKARTERPDRYGILAAVTTGQLRQNGRAASARLTASKVPQITASFWIIKVLTTAQGEATSDYLVHRINPVLAVGMTAPVFVAALVLQLLARRYVAWIYWAAVVMVAVFGTMIADVVHIALGVPYDVSTPVLAVALAVVFVAWYKTEKTLSIHSIRTRRREMFYWAAVLATFALGTAAGDLTAVTLGLGYLGSGIAFAVLIAVPAVANWRQAVNPILAFWFAYVVTRPLGASFADWMGVPHRYGGLDLGRGWVAVGLTIVIVGLVGFLAVTRTDVEERAAQQPPAQPRHRR
jgi:uncharacterized membrane-anchored protein